MHELVSTPKSIRTKTPEGYLSISRWFLTFSFLFTIPSTINQDIYEYWCCYST